MIGVLALALGFIAAMYVYRSLQSRSGVSSDSGVDVIVAADDLQVGARVEEHDIKIIKIPAADLPPGSPRRRSDELGHGVIVPISKGEFILPNRLAGENAGAGLPSLIPPGMRAVSVRVNERSSQLLELRNSRDPRRCPTDGDARGKWRTTDHHRSAERRSPSLGTHLGTNCDRRGPKYRRHHSSGLAGRCPAAHPRQLRRTHSTGAAQSARHQARRSTGLEFQRSVPGHCRSRARAIGRSSLGDEKNRSASPHLPRASVLRYTKAIRRWM